ncbi:MAG: IS5 family transposase [Bacteroidota bacterium]
MIRYTPSSEITLSLFKTPFETALNPDNRWVLMESLVPWDDLAKVFYKRLSTNMGRGTVDLRVVLGALLVKHIEDLSDEDTITYIQENIYAQFFVGLSSFQAKPIFAPSLFVEIRHRLGFEGSQALNDEVIKHAKSLGVVKHRASKSVTTPSPTTEAKPEVTNKGTVAVDATVSPLHIAYPTDAGLLNHAREHSEYLIDILYESAPEQWPVKPRTYRRNGRKDYLLFSKKRKKNKKLIRQAVGKQLRYLRRNIGTLHRMLDQLEEQALPIVWEHLDWRNFWIVQELYRQQEILYRDGRKRIDDRIISIEQPHARPIKRGKPGKKDTEFGPKMNVSLSEGIARVDQIDFNNFNESTYLQDQIEAYKALYGYYPQVVLADKIYRTRANRKYLKDRNIEMSGPPLGRKQSLNKSQKERQRKRNNKRNAIEGKFGQAKLKYGLDELFTRRPDTTKAEINLIFMAINLLKMAKAISLTSFNLYRRLEEALDHVLKRWKQANNIFYAPPIQMPLFGQRLLIKAA